MATRQKRAANNEATIVLGKESEKIGEKLWEYRLHEDNILYQRMNFFLVVESVLLAAYTTLFSVSQPNLGFIQLAIGILGIFLTVIWGFANMGQMNVIQQITEEAEAVIPIYAKIRHDRLRWPVISTWFLVYLTPLIILCTWLVLLVFE